MITSSSGPVAEVRLGHPLFGEVVRSQMPATRLDQIRLSLADAVEAGDTDPGRVVAVPAVWRADAGDHSRPEQLRTAALRVVDDVGRYRWRSGSPAPRSSPGPTSRPATCSAPRLQPAWASRRRRSSP